MFSVKNMHVYKLTEGLFFQEIYQKLIIPKKYFQNYEPLHKNDLVHESWVKVEFSHEKPVPKMIETASTLQCQTPQSLTQWHR